MNGVYTTVEDRYLGTFTATGGALDVLSPEYDMRSRIEFSFSHPLYRDTGALYSPEYIANRHDAKIDFLKHLSISPDIPVTSEDLVLSPDRAILTLTLPEGQKTDISLENIMDIYGRTTTVDYEIIAKQEPFLSLRLADARTYYTPDEDIPMKLYALKSPKNTYSIKLCRVPLEQYARLERILADDISENEIDQSYAILNGSGAYGCAKKDIDLTATGYVSPFSVDDIAPG